MVNQLQLGLWLGLGETVTLLNINWYVAEMLQILYKISVDGLSK